MFSKGKKLLTLIMDLKSSVNTVQQQNQDILFELTKRRDVSKPAVKILQELSLPLQTFEQVVSLERRFERCPEDKQQLVSSDLYMFKLQLVSEMLVLGLFLQYGRISSLVLTWLWTHS